MNEEYVEYIVKESDETTVFNDYQELMAYLIDSSVRELHSIESVKWVSYDSNGGIIDSDEYDTFQEVEEFLNNN